MAQQTRILSLDCGTTSVRAIVFDEHTVAIASSQREFTQHFPQPGFVEHDAQEIWTALLECMRDAIAKAHLTSRDITAIGITNQRETAVVWDRASGVPIHRAIVWQDRRTAAVMTQLRAQGHEDSVRAATGLTLDPYFSASKIAWILDHTEGARARAERGELACGTIDSWVLWNLTSGRTHATDASNASRTMLARITQGCAWDDELCALFRVPRAMLPQIVDSAGALAISDAAVLGSAIPVTGIAGDQQAALYGQRCIAKGQTKCTFGTGCFLLTNVGEAMLAPPLGLLTTVAWRIHGRTTYAIEGSVFVGGSAVQWLRDGLQFFKSAKDVNALAASVPDSGGVVVVPAFAGLGAPWWDAAARGAILGLTRGSTRAHIARATLEGIAHQVADLVEAIERAPGHASITTLRVDGGAAASDLLMTMQANLLGRSVERPAELESTAIGAALLARVGLGEALASAPTDTKLQQFTPTVTSAARDSLRARWKHAVDTVCTFGSPS